MCVLRSESHVFLFLSVSVFSFLCSCNMTFHRTFDERPQTSDIRISKGQHPNGQIQCPDPYQCHYPTNYKMYIYQQRVTSHSFPTIRGKRISFNLRCFECQFRGSHSCYPSKKIRNSTHRCDRPSMVIIQRYSHIQPLASTV